MKVQVDGKIVVGGSLLETGGTVTDFLVVRLNSDGSPDTGFDTDGFVTTKITTTTSAIVGLAIQSDNKIVALGSSSLGGVRDYAVTRCNVNGSPDNSLDQDGVLVTHINDDIPSAMAPSNGR